MQIRKYSAYIFADEVSLHALAQAEKNYYYFILQSLRDLLLLLWNWILLFYVVWYLPDLFHVGYLKFKKESVKKLFIVLFEFYTCCFLGFFLMFGLLCLSKYNSTTILIWGYHKKNCLAREGIFLSEIPTWIFLPKLGFGTCYLNL